MCAGHVLQSLRRLRFPARQWFALALISAPRRQKQAELVRGQPGLPSEFQDSQFYTETLSWENKQTNKQRPKIKTKAKTKPAENYVPSKESDPGEN